jgi:iron complex outermembrane receptor protein
MADYTVPLGPNSLSVQLSASYKGHQFYDSTNDPYLAQPAYWLENVRVAYDVGRWEVAVYVKNLSNLHYWNDAFDSTSPFGFIQPVVGTPRWFGGELNYRF